MPEDTNKERPQRGRVVVRARKKTITQKLEAGHALKTVYSDISPPLGISYSQFCREVHADKDLSALLPPRKPPRKKALAAHQATPSAITPPSEKDAIQNDRRTDAPSGNAFRLTPVTREKAKERLKRSDT